MKANREYKCHDATITNRQTYFIIPNNAEYLENYIDDYVKILNFTIRLQDKLSYCNFSDKLNLKDYISITLYAKNYLKKYNKEKVQNKETTQNDSPMER